ncbi:MAG TPA: sensor histidine kinase [Vicinamibacterales bacterium]|nr:sensor histidine kinase [Vicinamibacterales bacterium]
MADASVEAYSTEGRPAARIEYVLAVGRAFLAITGFVAIYSDPSDPERLTQVAYGILAAYAFYSAIVLWVIRRAAQIRPIHGRVFHGLDILFVAALTFVSEGPVSPFFLFYLFVVLSAAYRWGFRETVGTALLTALVFGLESLVAVLGPWRRTLLGAGGFELNRAIIRVGYLAITGFLMGYLAEEEKRFRSEMAAVADAMRQPRVELGLGGSVEALGQLLLRLFGASALTVVVREYESGDTTAWRIERAAHGRTITHRHDLAPGDPTDWLFPAPARTWHAAQIGADRVCRARAVQPDAWLLRPVTITLPPGLLGGRESVTATDVGLEGQWRGRVFLHGMQSNALEHRLRFFDSLMAQVAPALTNMVLLRRLRSQASAAERARVARELHDSTIQALIGIEMKIAAIARTADGGDPHVAAELANVQELLRSEILGVRELMQALRPVELDGSHELPDVLANVVERFRHDSGVSARFSSNVAAIDLPPVTSIEIVRIVQEALVNVRKHSRARNVLVRLTRTADEYTLTIEDDGRGFEFEGTYSQEQLDRARIGPAIIKERARLIGGRVSIESAPQVGARIEITFGVPAHV